jgi:hypothetical protein
MYLQVQKSYIYLYVNIKKNMKCKSVAMRKPACISTSEVVLSHENRLTRLSEI